MLPEIGLAKGACTLWEEELLLDYMIEVEDEQFRVHKLVMSSVSDYFKAMLTGGMVESREDKVRLEGLSSLAVRNVIEFVYTGQFGSSKASAEERLACAVYLQIPAAVKICATSLCEEVNKENCFHILSLFKSYGIKDGIDHTVKFMKHNIEDILDDFKPEDMTHDELLSLIDCWQKSEWQLFVMAIKWLKVDYEQRKEHANIIMSHIRFCLMSPTELALIESMKEMGIFSDSDRPWYELVKKALRYHDVPTHQKVLDESEQAKVRIESSPLCFGLHPSLSGQVFAIHKQNSWTRYDAVNPLVFRDDHNKRLPFNDIDINNFLVVCINSGEGDVQCSVFDPRTLTWSAMATMGVPRDQCGLVYHEKHLYALGGYDRRNKDSHQPTDVIEKYDFQTNTWSVTTNRLPAMLANFSVFSINGCIYIPGGWINEEEFSSKLHCFDPQAGEWLEKDSAALAQLYCNLVNVEIHGEKVIAGIDEDLKLHYYKPSTDKWPVYERCVPSKLKWKTHELGTLVATGNTIYFADFACDGESDDENGIPKTVSEKWTFGEKGLRIDVVRDRLHSEWFGKRITNFFAL